MCSTVQWLYYFHFSQVCHLYAFATSASYSPSVNAGGFCRVSEKDVGCEEATAGKGGKWTMTKEATDRHRRTQWIKWTQLTLLAPRLQIFGRE